MGLVLAFLAALGNVLGGLLIGARTRWSRLMLRLFVAIGAGFLLCVALLRMLPEALELAPALAMPLVVTGYFVTHLFEHTLVRHFHFGEETHTEVVQDASSAAATIGLGLHSFFDGVSIAAGFTVSPTLGWLVFGAIALHKLPEGFTIASIVRAAGGGRSRAVAASAVVGAACVLGAMLLAGREELAGRGLALATGVTIYVAATDLVPEVNKEVGHHLAFTVLGGVALYVLASWVLGLAGLS
ncbi:MAG TPA: ZIP family metal transporter [Gemmatimonadota bacterium]|jgi:ZIP family zinc transporter/zinc and cadmium transporter|nr:ZIP family metal transporter [Gemmatimonadota bacterium]